MGPGPQRGVYAISVAADLAGTATQNLRVYERRGLLSPARSDGGTRLYSADDVTRLQRIGELLGAGLNLVGVGMVLDLESRVLDLEGQLRTATRRKDPSG
jgi:DNA-binding transcriptional MerR regulator